MRLIKFLHFGVNVVMMLVLIATLFIQFPASIMLSIACLVFIAFDFLLTMRIKRINRLYNQGVTNNV